MQVTVQVKFNTSQLAVKRVTQVISKAAAWDPAWSGVSFVLQRGSETKVVASDRGRAEALLSVVKLGIKSEEEWLCPGKIRGIWLSSLSQKKPSK